MRDISFDSLPLFAPAKFSTAVRPKLKAIGDAFTDQVRNFSDFGQGSLDLLEGGVPYLVNEFWTSGQRQSHSLHEISYRACFKAQLPEFFIQRLTKPGDAVYDPFMGRGTTPVQAALMTPAYG